MRITELLNKACNTESMIVNHKYKVGIRFNETMGGTFIWCNMQTGAFIKDFSDKCGFKRVTLSEKLVSEDGWIIRKIPKYKIGDKFLIPNHKETNMAWDLMQITYIENSVGKITEIHYKDDNEIRYQLQLSCGLIKFLTEEELKTCDMVVSQ